MHLATLVLPALFTLASVPAFAQCGGHANHGEHGTISHNPSGHQENGPKVHATNTLCPVMGREVMPGRDREVVIRGNYYLVCCDGCGPEMSKHYDKYLDKDGLPLNAPKQGKTNRPQEESSEHQGHQH